MNDMAAHSPPQPKRSVDLRAAAIWALIALCAFVVSVTGVPWWAQFPAEGIAVFALIRLLIAVGVMRSHDEPEQDPPNGDA